VKKEYDMECQHMVADLDMDRLLGTFQATEKDMG
jgi:hypothetical protein